MKRRLNLKLLGVLVVGAAAFASAVHFLHAYQVKRNAGSLRLQAEREEQQGNYTAATGYLARYLALSPGDNDARAQYGTLLESLARNARDRLRVLGIFDDVLRQEPQRQDIRRKAIAIALSINRISDARTHLDEFNRLFGETFDKDAELNEQMGVCLLSTRRDNNEAVKFLRKAIRNDPARLSSYGRLAEVYQGPLENADAAEQVLKEMVKANDASYQAHLKRVGHWLAYSTPEQRKTQTWRKNHDVDAELKKARDCAPSAAEVLLACGEWARDSDDVAGARRNFERGVELHGADWRFYVQLASLELQAKQPAKAVEWLRRAVEAAPNALEPRWRLAELLIDTGKPDDARKVLVGLRQDGGAGLPAEFLEGRIAFAQGRTLEASRIVERIRPRLSGSGELPQAADRLLVRCYELLEEPDRRLAAAQRLFEADPTNGASQATLAAALVTSGRLDDALNVYRNLASRYPAYEAEVARLLVLRNLRVAPGGSDTDMAERWAAIETHLALAEKADPKLLAIPLVRAETLANQHQPDKARAVLEQARKEHPDRVEPWLALAAIIERGPKPEAALAILDDARKELGDRVELELARARHWARVRSPEADKALTEMENRAEAYPVDAKVNLLRALAEARSVAGQPKEAARLWMLLAKSRPEDLHSGLGLFDLAIQARDEAATKAAVAQLRSLEGEEGVSWRYAEACRLLVFDTGESKTVPDKARTLLAEAASRRPAWSRVPLLQAEIAEREGNGDRALEAYLRALDLGERRPSVVGRATDLLIRRQRAGEADRLVRKFQSDGPLPAELAKLGAEAARSGKDLKRARELAQQAVPADLHDYRQQFWLGEFLWRLNDRQEAVAAFERAANCNPDAPEVYLKLLLAYRDLKDAKLAQTLARAESKLQGSSHLLELGQCYEIAGRLDLAEKQFQAAVEAQPGNPRLTNNLAEFRMRQGHFDTAEPLLRGLVDNAKTPADIRTVARRSLAAGIASRGDYAGFRKALELIEQNLQADPDSFEDRRLKARVLANRPEQRAVALRVLDELAKAKSLRPDDQLLRARLADASGEWPAARDLMQSLLVSEPDNPSYLRPYIEGLLRHNNYPEAAALLARLESREPDALATLVLRVRLLKATGNAADAVSLVTGKANGTQAPLAALAQLLEEIGEVAPAEVLYRKLAEQTKKPADALQLARFLGRNNKATEGLQICQTLRTVAPVEDVAFVSVALVRLPSVTTAQRAEVETWLQHEVESRRSTGLLVSLADLRDGQGRFEEAEKLWRQVLAGDPTNLMALNNLACLLVFRGDPGPEAMELVNRAQQVYGPMPELLDTRALAHLARGEAKPAEADLEQAVSLHGSPAKYFHLARARRLDNNNQGARAAWEKAMAAGLTAKDLHPLEKPVYDQMVATIGK